jgi:Glycerate kinase
VPLDVACDVDARFLEAADVFAPQKGATPEQVRLLRDRLAKLDVPDLPGAGAAGGLAGGLAAIGARLFPGFNFVASRLGFDMRLAEVDLVVTGEGRLDATSFTGKVVGRVIDRAGAAGVETLVVAGNVASGSPIGALSLVERYGPQRALAQPAWCLQEIVEIALASRQNAP